LTLPSIYFGCTKKITFCRESSADFSVWPKRIKNNALNFIMLKAFLHSPCTFHMVCSVWYITLVLSGFTTLVLLKNYFLVCIILLNEYETTELRWFVNKMQFILNSCSQWHFAFLKKWHNFYPCFPESKRWKLVSE